MFAGFLYNPFVFYLSKHAVKGSTEPPTVQTYFRLCVLSITVDILKTVRMFGLIEQYFLT